METWRKLPGFDYDYEVSDMGRVRSWVNKKGIREEVPHFLSECITEQGYVVYQLRVDGANKRRRAHRLVLLAFCGESCLQVNHRNGDKTDNRLSNLEYVSAKENVRHSIEILKRIGGASGENHHKSRLTDVQVREVRSLASTGMTQRAIARRFRVSQSNVSDILHNRTRRDS